MVWPKKYSVDLILMPMILTFGIAGAAHAASGQVSFGGVVTKPNENANVSDYPDVIVSFGSQALLPLGLFNVGEQNVQIYDESGKEVLSTALLFVVSNGTRVSVQQVLLSEQRNQIYLACSKDKSMCIRYRVRRY